MLPNAVMYRGPEAQEKGAQRLRLVGIDVGWAGSTCPSTAPLVADNFGNVSLQNPDRACQPVAGCPLPTPSIRYCGEDVAEIRAPVGGSPGELCRPCIGLRLVSAGEVATLGLQSAEIKKAS